MIWRRTVIAFVLFVIPSCLYSQSGCVGLTFSGTKEVSLSTEATQTALARQPDGSYDAALLDIGSFQLGNLYSNYQNVILTGCPSAATPLTTLPHLPDNPPALGVGSQILAIADFQKAGIPSAVFSPSLNSTPAIDFARLSLLTGVSLSTYVASGDVTTVAAGDFNNDGNYDFVAVLTGDGTHPGGVQIYLGNGAGTFNSVATYSTGMYASNATVADLNKDG